MIHSRSPEQYDPTPFVAEGGKRFSAAEAPRGARIRAREFLAPTEDSRPILDVLRERRLTVEERLALGELGREELDSYLWAPRDSSWNRHNSVLASVREAIRSGRELKAVALSWLSTLREFPADRLIALSPGLDRKKIAEAELVLSRLIKLHEEEGAETHAKISG